MAGIAHGILGVLGLGSTYDPLGDARGKLSSKIQEFNNMNAQMSLVAAQEEDKTIKQLYQTLNAKSVATSKQLEDTTNLIWNSLEDTNLFIIFIYILVFVIVFYIVIK